MTPALNYRNGVNEAYADCIKLCQQVTDELNGNNTTDPAEQLAKEAMVRILADVVEAIKVKVSIIELAIADAGEMVM